MRKTRPQQPLPAMAPATAPARPPQADVPRDLPDVIAALDRLTPWPTLRLRCALIRRG
jgi:hypothetical protein